MDKRPKLIMRPTYTCTGNGFRYAGLKYWGVCYCGSYLQSQTVDSSECHQPCSGNANQICGGDHVLSVYEDPTFLKSPADISIGDFKPLGCHNDDAEAGRALSWQIDLPSESFTTSTCLDACRKKGFAYAGTEYGSMYQRHLICVARN